MSSDPGSPASTTPPTKRRRKDERDRVVVGRKTPDRLAPGDDVFFAVVQTTRMPMIVTDANAPDNPIVFANDAFLAMTGYEASEIIGSNCRFLQGPETDPAAIAELRDAIAARKEHTTEILNYRKDGYSFWNALFVAPVFDEAGDLVYYFASQLDVSRRRDAEDQLRQTEKMNTLGRLTGGIAHEFNNLLQIMVGYMELIDSGLSKSEPDLPKLRRNIGNARNAAERTASLTHQLLAFSRKQRLQGRVLNLNHLATSIRQLADRTLGGELSIETTLDPDLPNCRVDPTQIEVALLNILIHARDAMAQRPSKTVLIQTRHVVIDTSGLSADGLPQGRYASIAVSDTGVGIPPHVIERVMDPFFTTREDGKGTGLGLSMVYSFAKQSGGMARIRSDEGAGTTVSIFFPAVDEASSPIDKRGDGSVLERPGKETILVVEERTDVSELAGVILRDFGYQVLRAKDAREALNFLDDRNDIDLLLSDLVMPGDMTGVALAREARRRHPKMKALLTTGYVEASLERTDAGGWEFDVLNKPYGRLDLARKVRVILDGPTGAS